MSLFNIARPASSSVSSTTASTSTSPSVDQRKAFESLYKTSLPLVRKIVRSHGFDDVATGDLVQTIFMKAWNASATLQDAGSAKQWVAAIARNECRTEIRSRRRKERLGLTGIASVDEAACPIEAATVGYWSAHADDELTLEEKVMHGVVRAMIEGRIETKRVQVAKRYYLEGQSTSTISEETGIPVNTICSHLARFRAELRAEITAAETTAHEYAGEMATAS